MKDHCVIGRESPNGIGRTWLETEADAVAHAQWLLSKESKPNRLFIVKVIKVVEVVSPTVVRDLQFDDIPEAKKQS